MFWNILGLATVFGFVFLSGWEWYLSLPIGIVVACVVVLIGGIIKGKLMK